jgi:hypothetical protein
MLRPADPAREAQTHSSARPQAAPPYSVGSAFCYPLSEQVGYQEHGVLDGGNSLPSRPASRAPRSGSDVPPFYRLGGACVAAQASFCAIETFPAAGTVSCSSRSQYGGLNPAAGERVFVPEVDG